MRIHLWRGHHSRELLAFMAAAWERDELLVVCPPLLEDLSFVSLLPEGPLDFVGAWEQDPSVLEAVARRPRHPPTYPATPVYGVFTSGTVSGTPRLILYSRENIESSLGGILRLFDASRLRTVFSYPQPFHTFGLLLGYQLSLRLQARLVMAPGRYSRAAHALRLEVEDPDTLTLGTPTHFQDLLRLVRETGQAPAPSYSCIIGGAPVPVALWKSVREELRIEAPSIGYGCTEASPGLTHLPPGRMPVEDAEIGFPLEGVELRPPTPDGLEFSGPSVCLAILHAGGVAFPQRVLIRDDVRVSEDGVWRFQGRCDLVLNRGGEKFSLEHLERLIQAHTGLEAVCVSHPHERLGEDLGVLLRTAEGGAEPHRVLQLVQCLREKAHLRVEPTQVLCVREFPLNAAAKLDRRTAAQWSRTTSRNEPR